MKPSKPSGFVIYGAMRTGSNFLVSILNQFPGVVCHGEAFNPGFVGLRDDYYTKFGLTREEPQKRDADSAGFYERILERDNSEIICGFKLFPGHDEAVLQRTLSDPTLAKIVLKRDILTSFISLCQAEASGVWMIKDANAISRSASQRRSDVKIMFDGPRFLRYRERVSAFYRQVEESLQNGRQSYLELWYRDLQVEETTTMLAEFLGRQLPVEFDRASLLVKQNLSAAHERVLNVSEMVEFLDLHRYRSGVVEEARKVVSASPKDGLRVNGVQLNPENSAVSDPMYAQIASGKYEQHEARCIASLIEPGEIILELGGGIGYISSLAWLTGMVTKLVVVEANPETVPIIEETHRLNEVEALVINGIATSAPTPGNQIPFYIRSNFWASSLFPEPCGYIREVAVPATPFRDLLDTHKPTLLVCDIEGGEVELLCNTNSLGSVRKILLELHQGVTGATGVRDLFLHLSRLGYAYDSDHSRQSVVVFRRVDNA